MTYCYLLPKSRSINECQFSMFINSSGVGHFSSSLLHPHAHAFGTDAPQPSPAVPIVTGGRFGQLSDEVCALIIIVRLLNWSRFYNILI